MKRQTSSALTIALFLTHALLLTGVILVKSPFSYQETAGERVVDLVPLRGSFGADGAFHSGEIIDNLLISCPWESTSAW